MNVILYYEGDAEAQKVLSRLSIQSIRYFNPNATIFYISDGQFIPEQAEFVPAADYHKASDEIRSHYTHKHDSVPANIVWLWISRWFVIAEFCRANGIHTFYQQDTDVLCFCDLDVENKRWGETEVSSMVHPSETDCDSMGTCFVRNPEVLLKYPEYALWAFNHSTDSFSAYSDPGNICDMTMWTFYKKKVRYSVNDLGQVRDGRCFDANIAIPYFGWEMEGDRKKLMFEGGVPYGFKDGQKIRLNILHCWYKWKPRMQELWDMAVDSR